MKRYIEIVYDNSGSMNGLIDGKPKYEIAQDLFKKEILPVIGFKSDTVILRLLGSGCGSNKSIAYNLSEIYNNSRPDMLSKIKSISHDHSTPLFYAISDSIEACKKQSADEYIIFVLTDGDDTCHVKIEDIVDQDLLDKYVKFYKVLIVQLAIDSELSSNNITAITSYLGGQSIKLNSSDPESVMRSKLNKALKISSISSKFPLDHCFTSQPGFDLSWEEIKTTGIDFHQAQLIFNKGLLSWEPSKTNNVSRLEFAELKFLFGLFFTSGVPDTLVFTMLAQLKKPYYYSYDCIYWDFSNARWKYFVPQNKLIQLDNHEAGEEDNVGRESTADIDFIKQREKSYLNSQVYRVEDANTNNPSFYLKSLGKNIDHNKELILGDQVIFKIR
jgi:hypothetical protein